MAPSRIEPNEWDSTSPTIDITECLPLLEVKTIMITGGAGFIASWMTRCLTTLYADSYHIVCFDNFEKCSSSNNIQLLEQRPNFSLVKGDIRSSEDVMSCVREYAVDAIIHFAALSHVDLSFSNPCEFSHTNFMGTHNLLEAARVHRIQRFIHISTDEVYGEILPGGRDHVESDALHPTNPYSASKAAAEMMVSAYIKSFNIPAVIVRSNNVYGPNQFPEKLIPKFTMLLLRNQKVPLYGDGQYTRRYVFASDVVEAVNTIFHRGAIGEVYNIGTYDEISNRALCTMLLQIIKPKNAESTASLDLQAWLQPTADRPFHDRRYGVNFSKLTKLGWKQKVGFEQGLQMTVAWYRANGQDWWSDLETALDHCGK